MATWRDHPYWNDPYLFLLNPATVLAAQVSYSNTYTYGKVSGTSIWQYIFFESVTVGDASATGVEAGMTLLLGTTPGGDNLGRARVRGVTTYNISGTDYTVLMVWASPNKSDGGLYITNTTQYITVLNDFRVWMKPPYQVGASSYFDGSIGPIPATWKPAPCANAGPGYAGFVDPVTGLATVSFSGAESFATARDGVLGAWGSNIISSATISSSSESGTNYDHLVADGNNTTYWQPVSLTAILYLDFATARKLKKITITASGTTAPKQITLTDNSSNLLANFTEETGWGSHETRTKYIDYNYPDGGKTHFYIWVWSNNGGASTRIEEIGLYEEDRATAYDWDVDDGTITVGTSSSEDITATFPPGFRWVKLTVTDNLSSTGIVRVPVFASYAPNTPPTVTSYAKISTTGATFFAVNNFTGYGPEKAFDGLYSNVAHCWITANTTPRTLTGELGAILIASKEIGQYTLRAPYTKARGPKNWTFEYRTGSGDWTVVDTQAGITWAADYELKTFTLAAPVTGTSFRINVTLNNGDANYLSVAEFELWETVYTEYPPEDELITNFEVTNHVIGVTGQQMSFNVHENIALSDFPDGTLVMYWEDEYYNGVQGSLAGPSGREHMKFIGWIDTEPTEIAAETYDTRKGTVLNCLDVGGRLAQLTGFPFTFERVVTTPGYVAEIYGANLDRITWILLYYLSTAGELADFYWSGLGDLWGTGIIDIPQGDLYTMLDYCAQVIAYRFTCDKHGRLWIVADPMLSGMSATSRSKTYFEDLDGLDYVNIQYTHQRPGRYYWLWGSSIDVYIAEVKSDVSFAISTYFCVVPGEAPNQGATTEDHGEQLGAQAELNWREGHRYAARLNAPNSNFDLLLAHGGDIGFDPAQMQWIKLTISAEDAAQRGLSFTDEPFLIYEVRIEHDHDAGTKTVMLTIEREVLGTPAVTYTPVS